LRNIEDSRISRAEILRECACEHVRGRREREREGEGEGEDGRERGVTGERATEEERSERAKDPNAL
jgi:hypothetical protein